MKTAQESNMTEKNGLPKISSCKAIKKNVGGTKVIQNVTFTVVCGDSPSTLFLRKASGLAVNSIIAKLLVKILRKGNV